MPAAQTVRKHVLSAQARTPAKLRWEWRAFAEGGNRKLARFRDRGGPPEHGRELYIVSARSPHNVKIRDERLELKVLEVVDGGLELWRPALQSSFPLDPSVVRALYAAWRIRQPIHLRNRYGVNALRRDVVAVEPSLAAIHVDKQRTRIMVEGCQAEFVEVTVRRRVWWTVAIEDPDPDRVRDAVRRSGLSEMRTSNYPAALKRITAAFSAAQSRP